MQRFYTSVIAIIFIIVMPFITAADDSVPRITKEALKAKIEKGEDIIILDVRTGMSYNDSSIKIKGALRIPPNEIEARYKELPMDKEIITYCS